MEYIDIKKLFNDELSSDELNLISENIKSDFKMSFYGFTQTNYNVDYSNYQMYFMPMMYGITKDDILKHNHNTNYGYYLNNNDPVYCCCIDKIPVDWNFIDVFGTIYDYEIQENIVLMLKKEHSKIIYEYSEYSKDGSILLGRLAKIDKNCWKFHPIFKQTNTMSAITRNYLNGDFLYKNKVS